MHKCKTSFRVLGTIFLVSVMGTALRADQLGVTFDDTTGASPLGNPPFTLGWQFTVTSAIQVNSLAMYDENLDGLADSYSVGLWDSSGNLLVSGTVAAGTVDPLNNQFREIAVSATVLNPGDYFIGALFLTTDDPVFFPGSSLTNFASGPGVTYDQSTFAFGSTLSAPTTPDGTPGFFGPNFDYTAVNSSVPEPGSMMLLGTVVGSVLFRLRRTPSNARL